MMTQGRVRRVGMAVPLSARQSIRFLPREAVLPAPPAAPAIRKLRFLRENANRLRIDPVAGPLRIAFSKQHCGSAPEFAYESNSVNKVTTTVSRDACEALAEFCQATNIHGREVGGILAGHCRQKLEGFGFHYQLSVTDIIPLEALDSSSDHISFGEPAWSQAECQLQSRYAAEGKRKLGWYHTHPTQGIFFSLQDHAAHAVFSAPYHFALVIDPRSMEAGLFYWRDHMCRIVAGPIRFPLLGSRS